VCSRTSRTGGTDASAGCPTWTKQVAASKSKQQQAAASIGKEKQAKRSKSK